MTEHVYFQGDLWQNNHIVLLLLSWPGYNVKLVMEMMQYNLNFLLLFDLVCFYEQPNEMYCKQFSGTPVLSQSDEGQQYVTHSMLLQLGG